MRTWKAVIFLVGMTIAHLTCAMDNEPDGFRGIAWGAKPDDSFHDAPLSIRDDDEELRRFFGKASNFGWDFDPSTLATRLTFETLYGIDSSKWIYPNLKYITRRNDKFDFSGVPTDRPVYAFYKDQFLGVTMTFMDTVDGEKIRLSHYESKQKIDTALIKYFGPSDRQKLSFLSRLSYDSSKPTYMGEKANIISTCRGTPKGAQSTERLCKLTFFSVVVSNQMQQDLKEYQAKLVSNVNGNTDRTKAEQAAKPDY